MHVLKQPTYEKIREVVFFQEKIKQTPPIFSALKISGVYICSIAHDIREKLSTRGYIFSLKRVRVRRVREKKLY